MKVGSIVELVIDWSDDALEDMQIADMEVPTKGVYYMVRDVFQGPGSDGTIGVGLRFEEIINPVSPIGVEYGYLIRHFRELIPPFPIEIGDYITTKY